VSSLDEYDSEDQHIEPGLPIESEWGADHRSGFVALVGKPNVGKSTLLNAWLPAKLAPVSPKPQTTRSNLRGILTRPDAQIIFVDTPGIHLPHNKLGEYMVKAAQTVLADADVLVFVVDVCGPPAVSDLEIARRLMQVRTPIVLALNKMDLVAPEDLLSNWKAYESLGEYDDSIGISATEGNNLDTLLEAIIVRLPLGPRYYPPSQLSDQSERWIASEIIREQVLRELSEEVPHSVAVVVQDYNERENGALYISAYIYAEKESQKGIVIGRGGRMLKKIGRGARREIEQFSQRRVYLDLWVKVRKNWRRRDQDLREFGYDPHDL